MSVSERELFAADALLPTGWARNVLLEWNEAGRFVTIAAGAPPPPLAAQAQGPVIAGVPNVHSHAFQRAFSGLAEFRDASGDSFWSWRTLMYRVASAITPAQLEAVAAWLYVEMLEAGYTSVCEFHYIHHDTDGRPYDDPATLSLCLLRAAGRAGIGLTLLPVLYQSGGFGGVPPGEGQRRFIQSTGSMLTLLERLKPLCGEHGVRLGLAPHSLRAVPPDSLGEALAGLDAIDATAPIHIHIAEQTREVEECLAWSGQRPVEWLLDHANVDARWCLVHATHMTREEAARAGRTGAVAGLCPTTEANLGDGIFDMPAWRAADRDGGGRWGIGSDSHVCVNAAEELMMLEYGQRLRLSQRNVISCDAHPQVGTTMMLSAVAGGTQAAGYRSDPSDGDSSHAAGLAVGQRADFVVLDAQHELLAGLPAPQMLAAHIFASHRVPTLHAVWAAGRQRVASGRHALHDEAAAGFVAARAQLISNLSA